MQKAPLSLWKSIVITIILTFVIVSMFGVIIFLVVSSAQQAGISKTGYIAIFVVISGIFAWLLKRVSDTASSMSHLWFSDKCDEQD